VLRGRDLDPLLEAFLFGGAVGFFLGACFAAWLFQRVVW